MNRSLRYLPLVCFAFSALDACAQEARQPHICDRVAIDSVKGDVGIWRDKIKAFARARGLTGPIDYVIIVAPVQSGSTNKIRRMILWWKGRPMARAVCRVGPDTGARQAVNCAIGFPGTQLRLDVTFEPDGTRNPKRRTKQLVKYVARDVLCKLD